MAKIYQGSGAEDTTSQAERDMLDRLEALPDDFTVIHSVRWITHNTREHGTVGEADFVVAHPAHGVLILEVKGGEIRVERNQWISRDRFAADHPIKDPFAQADRSRYALLEWLKNDHRTRQFTYPVFSAVVFPDVGVAGDLRPDSPRDIIIDLTRLDALEKTLLDIFAFWRGKYPHLAMDGRPAVEALVDLLVPTRQLQSRIAAIFARERRAIDELTQQQFRVLRLLQHHRQAAIVGGAGTGKTMLAMEKAQQLATAGFRVLFLCYNRNLCDWLNRHLSSENILVATYHGLVGRAINWARLPGLPPMDMEEFGLRAPDLLLDAVSAIRAPGSGAEDRLFDAIIVDEAQDFQEHWWVPLPDLMKDPKQGIFYVFFDNNQRIYTQLADVPTEAPPFSLDENCRNTRRIHAALSPYKQTAEESYCHGPEGRSVEVVPAVDGPAAREALKQVLLRLVNEDGVDPGDIVILSPRSEKNSQWKSDDRLGTLTLSWDMDADAPHTIRVCTIYSFKGLESSVVILTELDQAKDEVRDQLIYVGLSRARNHVVVVGKLPEPLGTT